MVRVCRGSKPIILLASSTLFIPELAFVNAELAFFCILPVLSVQSVNWLKSIPSKNCSRNSLLIVSKKVHLGAPIALKGHKSSMTTFDIVVFCRIIPGFGCAQFNPTGSITQNKTILSHTIPENTTKNLKSLKYEYLNASANVKVLIGLDGFCRTSISPLGVLSGDLRTLPCMVYAARVRAPTGFQLFSITLAIISIWPRGKIVLGFLAWASFRFSRIDFFNRGLLV